jgi:GT2 family glycosyltransferase
MPYPPELTSSPERLWRRGAAATPQVTVVLPTHNRPQLLKDAMASLVAQTHRSWEAIVVDDGSTPKATLETADPRFRIVRHSVSLGGAAAKNTGLRHARGDVVAFLDDDDLYAPEYLARAVEALQLRPDLDVVFMGVTWFGTYAASGQHNYDRAMHVLMATAGAQPEPPVVVFDDKLVLALLKSVPMALQRPVVRGAALQRIGLYQEDCLLWDCDWAIRAALKGRVALMNEGLYRQRADRQGYSSHDGRLYDQLQSNIEIKDRLWQQSRGGAHAGLEPYLLGAASDAHFGHAWDLYQDGRRLRSLGALASSARRRLGTQHLKLMMRCLLPAMSPKRRAQATTGQDIWGSQHP